ncbi:MAG: hypothetical protein WCO26_22880 [Deltaproteobacteria bacterium]
MKAKCPICKSAMYSWCGNLISCKGTVTSAKHKFYLKWRGPLTEGSDESRELELAVAAGTLSVGQRWLVKDDVDFPPK